MQNSRSQGHGNLYALRKPKEKLDSEDKELFIVATTQVQRTHFPQTKLDSQINRIGLELT